MVLLNITNWICTKSAFGEYIKSPVGDVLIGSTALTDKAMMLSGKDATFLFYNFIKLLCLYAEHNQLTSYL